MMPRSEVEDLERVFPGHLPRLMVGEQRAVNEDARTEREQDIMRCVRELCVERDLDVATVGTVLAVVAEGLLNRLVVDVDADQLLTDLAVSGASLAA
jgi:hypothetical protein